MRTLKYIFIILTLGAIGFFVWKMFFKKKPIEQDENEAETEENEGVNPNFQSRGYRNNNPLCVMYTPSLNWLGQVGQDGIPPVSLAQFDNLANGVRAGVLNLYAKYKDGRANSLFDIHQIVTNDSSEAIKKAFFAPCLDSYLGVIASPIDFFDKMAVCLPSWLNSENLAVESYDKLSEDTKLELERGLLLAKNVVLSSL